MFCWVGTWMLGPTANPGGVQGGVPQSVRVLLVNPTRLLPARVCDPHAVGKEALPLTANRYLIPVAMALGGTTRTAPVESSATVQPRAVHSPGCWNRVPST